MSINPSANDDIETWREVHRHLTLAIIQSRDNVAAELAKRRYLLEEINRSPAGGPPPSAVPYEEVFKTVNNKNAPKKVSAGKHSKNITMSSSVKQGKQSTKYPPNIKPSPPFPLNNLLPTQK